MLFRSEERQRLSAARKPIESRIKRLEEQMAKASTRKNTIEARLAEPGIYDEANKAALKELLTDQAFVARELALLEEQWLEQQQQLEALAA